MNPTLLRADGGGLLSSSAIPQVLLLIAILLLAAAVSWRAVRVVRVRGGVRAGLSDADPGVRIAAVSQAAELGLATTAPALLRAVRAEADPVVLAAVVDTVASRQWEPASTGQIVALRLWARAYIDSHPELRGRSGSSAPLLAGVAGATTPPSLDPARAAEFHRDADVGDSTRDAAVPAPRTDPDPMHPTTVLVTGAGGAAGVAVIRALQARGHRVVAVDCEDTAVGLRLADESHVVPRSDDPQFLTALLRIATVSSAQALICTVAEEYEALSGAGSFLDEAGVKSLMPTWEAVSTCLDKWSFHEAMTRAGLPVPATGLGRAAEVPGPWIVKPRFGRGSRGVRVATTQQRLRAALAETTAPIVSTLLEGREFTADALVDPSGSVVVVAPRWRDETRGGISTKGETFADPEVTNVATLVLKAIGLIGPANVQGFVAADGTVSVHEVNPRFSGGLPLTVHAGADIVTEYLRAIMGQPMRPEMLAHRPGARMQRYLTEVFQG